MKKYDCSKTLDYSHELTRLCTTYEFCKGCPLLDEAIACDDALNVSQEEIDIVQKWSDEHPEPPKLTKKERTFLECFNGNLKGRVIKRGGRYTLYEFAASCSRLKDEMFAFLEEGEKMTFEELLKLEVEE